MRQVEPGPDLTERIIGLGIEVHRTLGPGLIESVYHHSLILELERAGLAFKREVPIPALYKGTRLPLRFYADLIVENTVLIEVKAVEHIIAAHEAQTLTYLRLSGCQVGLLMNFHARLLKEGLRRFIP